MIELPQNAPAEAGLYFAKTVNSDSWNLLVEVYGQAPFLQAVYWRIGSNSVLPATDEVCHWAFAEFGPKVEMPNPDTEAAKEKEAAKWVNEAMGFGQKPEPKQEVVFTIKGADLQAVLSTANYRTFRAL